jgi:hypothetical protein
VYRATAARRSKASKLHATYYLTLLKPPEIAIEPERMTWIEAAVRRASGWYFAPDVSYPAELHDLIGDDVVEQFAIAGTPPNAWSRCAGSHAWDLPASA